MNPSGVQLARAMRPPGRQTRAEFVGPGGGPGGRDPVDGEDGVEGGVGEREVLGVSLDELDLEVLGRGPNPSAFEQCRDVIDADRLAASAGRCQSGIPTSRGHIENSSAGQNVRGLTEVLGLKDDAGGDDGEIAAGPGALLAPLDCGNVGHGRGLEGGIHQFVPPGFDRPIKSTTGRSLT